VLGVRLQRPEGELVGRSVEQLRLCVERCEAATLLLEKKKKERRRSYNFGLFLHLGEYTSE
jgi:hypothetical protein